MSPSSTAPAVPRRLDSITEWADLHPCMVRSGLEAWVRERMLPRLVAVSPEEVADRSRAGRIAVLRRLTRALVAERARGRAGHWSYSLDRHLGLVQAVAAERAALTGPGGARDGGARSMRRRGDDRAMDATATHTAAQKETAADEGPRR